MRRTWSLLVSMRTTAILIAVLAGFLVLNVAVPQRATDPDAFDRLARSGPMARLLVARVGLGDLATSAPFLAVVALFFVNLAAVLADRIGTTARRLRSAAPTEAQVAALLAGGLEGEARAGPGSEARARAVLETLGYRTRRVGSAALWGVKHRWALLGFPLFHAAFFVLAAGGLLLYFTRDVVTLLAAEGQTVSSARGGVVCRAPLGPPAPVDLTVLGVEIDLEAGVPLELASTLRLEPSPAEQVSRINGPAVWGDLTVLTERAGIAPVLWLVDPKGAIVDRVAVVAAGPGDRPTRVTFLDGALEAAIEPVRPGPAFPERDALARTPVRIRVTDRGRVVHDGELLPGGAVEVGGGSLKLQELRYWVGLRLVRERGGAWLVAGFVLSILGIAWRMVWHRRELAVTWGDGRFRIGGRSEYYPRRFRGELEHVRSLLEAELARAGQT